MSLDPFEIKKLKCPSNSFSHLSLHMWGDVKECCWPSYISQKLPTAAVHVSRLEEYSLPQSARSKGRTAGSISQRCGWPAACPPINIMQVCCCDLPCVSPQLRSITRTDCTPPPPSEPPPPPPLSEGLVCAFSTSLSYIPSLKGQCQRDCWNTTEIQLTG